jgi:hypothetical protein
MVREAVPPAPSSAGAAGAATPAPAGPPPRRDDPIAAALAGLAATVPAVLLLRSGTAFCRACGADVPAGSACPQCARPALPRLVAVDPLPPGYSVRRGLRHRTGVRIAADASTTTLLFDNGKEDTVATSTLPQQSAVDGTAEGQAWTAPGQLLYLAAASRAGTTGRRWNDARLVGAAVAAVSDPTGAHLLALDAINAGVDDVVDALPLTVSERSWLHAVAAARRHDVAALAAHVAALPPAGYRAKLVLLLMHAPRLAPYAVHLAPQIAPFAENEPLARLVSGPILGRVDVEADDVRALRALLPVPEPVAAHVDAVLRAVDGAADDVPAPIVVGPAARGLVARTAPSGRMLLAEDVATLPEPVLDDAVDRGTVDVETLAACADAGRRRYLLARTDPRRLSDDDVVALGFDDERSRRAFVYAQPRVLDDLGDTPLLRHYRALAALRRNRPQDVDLADVDADARPIVGALLALREAVARGDDVVNALSDELLEDPTVWPVVVEITTDAPVEPTPALRARHAPFCEWLALTTARNRLFLGDWRGAVRAAEVCLELAQDEAVRDEALNLRACGLHELGDDAGAIASLEEAIRGDYSDALLANIGIVAAGLQPETAAFHLARLMREAPTTAMRVAAARRALMIWRAHDTTWAGGGTGMPAVIRDPLRELVTGDIDVDDFRLLLAVLVAEDQQWLADAAHLNRSPHRSTLEARYYVARAQGLLQLIDVLAEVVPRPACPSWLLDERDAFRGFIIESALDDIDDIDEDDSPYGVLALRLAEEHVLADRADESLFYFVGIAIVTRHLTSIDKELADAAVETLLHRRAEWQSFEPEVRDRIASFVELAVRRAAINRVANCAGAVDNGIDVYNALIDRLPLLPPGSPAYYAARRELEVVADVAHRAEVEIARWVGLVEDEDLRTTMSRSLESARELARRSANVLRR